MRTRANMPFSNVIPESCQNILKNSVEFIAIHGVNYFSKEIVV
jgi:hypothetical protein